jgi:ribosome-associated protein
VAGSTALPERYKERALDRLGGRLVNGVLTVRAEEHRSQLRNREAAKLRLAALLVEATAPPPKTRRPTKPSRRVQARRLENKRRRGEVKRGRSGRFDD